MTVQVKDANYELEARHKKDRDNGFKKLKPVMALLDGDLKKYYDYKIKYYHWYTIMVVKEKGAFGIPFVGKVCELVPYSGQVIASSRRYIDVSKRLAEVGKLRVVIVKRSEETWPSTNPHRSFAGG